MCVFGEGFVSACALVPMFACVWGGGGMTLCVCGNVYLYDDIRFFFACVYVRLSVYGCTNLRVVCLGNIREYDFPYYR